ncbi:MAG: glycosyltransferase, partial [Opitutales bacterium]
GPDIETLLRKQNFSFETTGFLDKPKEVAEAYGRADVFLFCSIADNLPLTVIETMACGTPMVGFATGGTPEITEHQKTGFLVDTGNQAAVNEGLRLALQNPDMVADWSREGVKRAREMFSKEAFVNSHLALYEELLEEFSRGGFNRTRRWSGSSHRNVRNPKTVA